MKVIKFCACGVKLERDVSDEETARKVVHLFWTEHAGAPHKPLVRREYDALIRKIVKKNWEKGLYPIAEMTELEAFEGKEIEQALDWLERQETN